MDTRQLKHRLMEQYEIVKTIESDTTAHKTIDLIQKKYPEDVAQPSQPKRFFMKREKKCMAPLTEVIGLEVFRYLLPHQPKTSLLVDDKPNEVSDYRKLYIISREIDGFKQFYKFELSDFVDGICDGTYSGLGEELVATLFVGDDDLHTANVGVDSAKRVVRIDGGFFFESKKELTTADIDALPLLDQIYPKNWLGVSSWNEDKKNSSINNEKKQIYKKIMHQADFRREVNRMLLRILVQPPSLLDKLVSAYEPDGELHGKICIYLNKKQNELMKAALGSKSFRQYLFSQESLDDLSDFFTSAVNFKTIGKQPLLNEDNIEQMMRQHGALLKKASVNEEKNSSFIQSLYNYLCGSTNRITNDHWRELVKAELVKLIDERRVEAEHSQIKYRRSSRASIASRSDDGPVALRTRSHTKVGMHTQGLFASGHETKEVNEPRRKRHLAK